MKKKLKTFSRGGVVLTDRNRPPLESSIPNGTLPAIAVVPLLQHQGPPAECWVSPGDLVEEEQLLGKAAGEDSVPVHSPIPGRVQEIREIYLADGRKSLAVVIALRGAFSRTGRKASPADWQNRDPLAILQALQDKGLVEMGGPPVSLYRKYRRDREAGIKTFILNGTDGEPCLTVNKALMESHLRELIEGLMIATRILEPERIIVGIAEDQRETAERWARALARSGLQEEGVILETAVLEARYPQADERILMESLAGITLKSSQHPRDAGGTVCHAATLKALYDAVVWGKPLVDRYITLAGRGLQRPVVRRIRLGMPLSQLLEEAEGLSGEAFSKIVVGGPMSGNAVYDPATPVTKASAGVLVLTAAEVRDSRETQCLRCGRCIAACPAGLDPIRLYKLVEHGRRETAGTEGLLECRECGSCGYVCPARIPLVQGLKLGKALLREAGWGREKGDAL